MNDVLLIALQKRGGGALDASGLSNGLCDNRFRHTIIVSTGNEHPDEFNENEYRRTVRIETYGGSMRSFLAHTLFLRRPLRLIDAIRRARPAIVHVIHFHPWDVFVFMLRPFMGYQIVYGVQEDPYSRKDANNPAVMGPLERMFVRRADLVAPYSEFMKRELARHVPESKLVPIFAGDYRRWYPAFAHKGFHMSGPLRLFFFGPIKGYKGVDVLVNALEICRRNGVNVRLTIAGMQSPSTHILEPEVVHRLGITWVDRFLSQEEVAHHMEDADVMVIPYRHATQTTPGLLAITYGLPAIGTRTGGLSEQIEDGVNGLLAAPGDPESLAGAIWRIEKDRSLLKKFSAGARGLYRTKFNWDMIAARAIKEVYGQLLTAPSAVPKSVQ